MRRSSPRTGEPPTAGPGWRGSRGRAIAGGFTLLEVLIAVLIAMIGLVGTVAIQQTLMNASQNSNEQAIAMRLAMQRTEEFSTRRTVVGLSCTSGDQIDDFAAYPNLANWNPRYYNARGEWQTSKSRDYRFRVEDRVSINGGSSAVVGGTYDISVKVTYALDNEKNKVVQIDQERRKCW